MAYIYSVIQFDIVPTNENKPFFELRLLQNEVVYPVFYHYLATQHSKRSKYVYQNEVAILFFNRNIKSYVLLL